MIMKKIITFAIGWMYVSGSFILADCTIAITASPKEISRSFTIMVPQELLEQKASLIMYMVNGSGNQCISRCQLDQGCAYRKISQDELFVATGEDAWSLDKAIELTPSDLQPDQVAVLHFEFDNEFQLVRVLVFKENLLENNPFDVLTLSVSSNCVSQADSVDLVEDDLDNLFASVESANPQLINNSILRHKGSLFEQYAGYAELFMIAQYGRVKRAMSNMSGWFY